MAEIVNLRQVRKRRARAEAEAEAAVNRAAHGRSKTEIDAEDFEAARRDRALDQSRIERPDHEDG